MTDVPNAETRTAIECARQMMRAAQQRDRKISAEYLQQDKSWVGKHADYPSLSHLSSVSEADALEGIKTLIEAIEADVPVVPCSSAIVYDDKEEKFLLLRRSAKRDIGLWEFPGGKFDKEEVHANAVAERELYEETGLAIRPEFGHKLTQVAHFKNPCLEKDCIYDEYVFLIEKKFLIGEAYLKEPETFSEVRWATFDELFSLPLVPDCRKAVLDMLTTLMDSLS